MFADRRFTAGTLTQGSAPVAPRGEGGRGIRAAGGTDRGAHPPVDPSVLRALDCLYGDEQD